MLISPILANRVVHQLRHVRVAHESHIILLPRERNHLESEHQAAKDFPWVQDGEPCFPTAETALVSLLPSCGVLTWENVGFASVGVVEEDRQGDVLDADYKRWDAYGDVSVS
jgi:hypothetical protein